MTLPFSSRNPLSNDQRAKLVHLLNGFLAASIDLSYQAKQAHWNVKGPDFQSLHTLFDAVHTKSSEATDLMAERVAQLGGYAEGTIRLAAQRSRLHEYDLEAIDGRAHVDALAARVAAFSAEVRTGIDEVGFDPITEDLLIGVVRGIENELWMLESHLASDGHGERREVELEADAAKDDKSDSEKKKATTKAAKRHERVVS